ncbi:MAG: dihydropteroate synthase [Betaproteobacteria bacterium]|nr:dihydropteroate synthase [Betaproteobacteria bacterium]
MASHILFLTGHLAHEPLRRVLGEMGDAGFAWTVHDLGLQVAALMTADMIARRLHDTFGADRIIVPGRCRGDLEALSRSLGVPVERGPDELADLPEFFGRAARRVRLDRHDVLVFAELTEAPRMPLDAIAAAAQRLAADGADVIDLGCLPQTPFPQLEQAVRLLHEQGLRVSVDSQDPAELARGARAGADYLLSLHLDSLDLAFESDAVPVLVPSPGGGLDSLLRAMERLEARNRDYFADPILDPLPFGFTDSLVRYHELRRRAPQAPMLMGTGNISELVEADTSGMHALLLGVMCELRIGALLTTQVSPHCRSAVREIDYARRLMWAARELRSLPKGLGDGLLGLHHRKPFVQDEQEIREFAAGVRDPNFRIQVGAGGIHVYNRDGMRTGIDPFELWPQLGVGDDASHAFYLGVELARAQIAWQLGKRYAQDETLHWGCMGPAPTGDAPAVQCAPGTTRRSRRREPAS